MVAKTSERGQPTIWQSFATTDMGFRDRKYNFSWRGNTIWVAEEIRFGFGVEIGICLPRQENVGKTGLTLFPVFVPIWRVRSKLVFPLSTLHFDICTIFDLFLCHAAVPRAKYEKGLRALRNKPFFVVIQIMLYTLWDGNWQTRQEGMDWRKCN